MGAEPAKPALQASADPLVSVVLPTFNRARTLPRAIASVLHQGYRHLELLIVDDGSTDDTAAVIAGFTDPRVRYIPLAKNGGASHARNAGMRESKGEFIAFQDSDDEWLDGKLEKQVRAALAAGDSAVTVFHSKILYGRDDQGRYGPHRVCCLPSIPDVPEQNFIQLIHRGNLISPQALLISREAFNLAGFFDEDLINNEDWAFGIDLFYASKVVFIDEPLVMTYLQNDSVSRLMLRGARAQIRVMQKLRRHSDFAPAVLAAHLGRIGWGVAKLGYPKRGQRLLGMALRLQPKNLRNWARAVVARLVLATKNNRTRGPGPLSGVRSRKTE